MSIELVVAIIVGVMMVAFVILILLWAITEELPRADRIPYYERLTPGNWAVRIERVGRRKARTFRLVNEVLGGDPARAHAITERPPAILVEGISETIGRELLADLSATGASAELYQMSDASPP